MPSTNPLRTFRRPDPPLRRSTRLAGVVAAAALALTLAACGSSESDRVEELATSAAAAAEVNIPEALKELDKSFGATKVPDQDELRKKYDEWLAGKARSAGTESSVTPGSDRPDKPLAVGDCTDHLPTGAEDTAADIASVDCDGEHLTEVYRSVPLDQLGKDYPRHSAILSVANDGCEAGFVEYVGAPWLDSQNTFQFVTPTKESWQAGDTTALCFAYPISFAPFTGTLQGQNS